MWTNMGAGGSGGVGMGVDGAGGVGAQGLDVNVGGGSVGVVGVAVGWAAWARTSDCHRGFPCPRGP